MIEDLAAGDWETELEDLFQRVAGRFCRVEPRRRMRAYVRGLLSPVGRKNGWQLAEFAGHDTPDGLQHLLSRARWDADEVRDDLQQYVADHLGRPGGVLIVDGTGFLKKGTTSAGVQRQYSGTAGRTENCQIGVFAAYATAAGRALVDRELYMPKSWLTDRERCREARVPAEREFATKGDLAKAMVARALASELPIAWVTADAAYGQEWRFRRMLEEAGVGYVVAVPKSQQIKSLACIGRIDELIGQAPEDAWQRLSAGQGAKGPRVYDWAAAKLPEIAIFDGEDPTHHRWILARRSTTRPDEVAYDRNRLLSATTSGSTASYNYDPFGRLNSVTSGGQVIESKKYDGFDHVVEHTKLSAAGETKTTTYTYDPLERTASKTDAAGETTDFNYLGLSGKVLGEEVAGELTKSYQYSPWGERLSQVTHNSDGTSEDAYYGYNSHTDVETLTTDTGETKSTYGYTAYGSADEDHFTGIDKPDPANPTKEAYNSYRFNSKRWDAASGTYDMGFRDYSPGLNRFTTRDMYNGALANMRLGADPFTSNRYAFTAGNPTTHIELDGHRLAVCDEPGYDCTPNSAGGFDVNYTGSTHTERENNIGSRARAAYRSGYGGWALSASTH